MSETTYPPPERLYPRFMALAEKYPKDLAAVDALDWVVRTMALAGPEDEPTQRKALGLLCRDHLAGDKLPLVFGTADEGRFLRTVLEEIAHHRTHPASREFTRAGAEPGGRRQLYRGSR